MLHVLEFIVDVKGYNSFEVVVVKKMEHDGTSTNEGLNVGVVLMQVIGKAFLNFGKELTFASSPLEKRARRRCFAGHAFK